MARSDDELLAWNKHQLPGVASCSALIAIVLLVSGAGSRNIGSISYKKNELLG